MDDRRKRRSLPQDSGHSQAEEQIGAAAQVENGDDEMDALFWNMNFAAENEGFRLRLWEKLKKRMEEMEAERELPEETLSDLAAGGNGGLLYRDTLKRMLGQ